MTALEILTAARERAAYTWDPDCDVPDRHVSGIMRYVAWADWERDTDTWSEAWWHLYNALPDAYQRDYETDLDEYADQFLTDEAVDDWTVRANTMSEVLTLFDVAIRAAS